MNSARVVTGSRASTLALVQAESVAALLRAADPGLDVGIATTGDRVLDAPLSQIDGKGPFTGRSRTP